MNPNEHQSTPRRRASSAAARIATIIEAAEQAASAVIDNADADAQRYLEEARAEADRIVAARLASIAELTDSLVDQAEAIRRQSERLLDSLERIESRLEPRLDRRGPAEPDLAAAAEGLDEEPDAESELDSEDDLEWRDPRAGARLTAVASPGPSADAARAAPAGARLLATQMAVSGSSRDEIERRLRGGFEIADPTPILDAILGPEE